MGGKNHQLALNLVHQGATLVGTEDPALLIKEYQLIKSATSGKRTEDNPNKRHNYMAERDAFIVRQIDRTLKDGETGILFLGMLHRVDEMLPTDIAVEYLIYHLPFKETLEKN